MTPSDPWPDSYEGRRMMLPNEGTPAPRGIRVDDPDGAAPVYREPPPVRSQIAEAP